jgi:hypothetical protein
MTDIPTANEDASPTDPDCVYVVETRTVQAVFTKVGVIKRADLVKGILGEQCNEEQLAGLLEEMYFDDWVAENKSALEGYVRNNQESLGLYCGPVEFMTTGDPGVVEAEIEWTGDCSSAAASLHHTRYGNFTGDATPPPGYSANPPSWSGGDPTDEKWLESALEEWI